MVLNRPPLDLKFSIYNKELSVVKSYKYLCIISNKNQTNLYNRKCKTETSLYCSLRFPERWFKAGNCNEAVQINCSTDSGVWGTSINIPKAFLEVIY